MSIELKNVTKLSGAETHIYETNLRFEEGGFNILLGTTLAGKTTLLRLMAGLEKPSQGEVWFNGQDVTGVAVQRRNVAMVYQQFINYPNMTVYENIASPLRVVRTPATVIRERVGEVAELLKLTPMLDRMPNELSGGQQQRTALARALVKRAELVLLDEPLANLDYKLREELREELPKLFHGTGATVVYATTEPIEAMLLGGYTATVSEGRITQYGRTSDVYHFPNDLVSAQVFSDPPINTATVNKRGDQFQLSDTVRWTTVDTPYRSLEDGPYTLGFRPHHISLNRSDNHSVKVSGEVMITEISGSESVIHVKAGDDNWVSMSHGIHRLEVGDLTELYIQTDRCFLFDNEMKLIRV
ncbi:ABC transporter ATP-binding protein [Sedimenticola sp.]|uniref:ABC transporter ATP-binding protein n=1 Tax=Sedimenticola sp. TaxID=1940285 RepID=UPI003D0B5C01